MNSKLPRLKYSNYKWVYWNHRGYWEARIKEDGKRIFLGSFPTEEEAAEAVKKRNSEHDYSGEFSCLDQLEE